MFKSGTGFNSQSIEYITQLDIYIRTGGTYIKKRNRINSLMAK